MSPARAPAEQCFDHVALAHDTMTGGLRLDQMYLTRHFAQNRTGLRSVAPVRGAAGVAGERVGRTYEREM